mmetsp:Transcript_15930/g.24213  ORF Transcript_15930/g.24213 Transcript_15930/m.24213 type:complete len:93 (-) Transcript_15930:27-305(-)
MACWRGQVVEVCLQPIEVQEGISPDQQQHPQHAVHDEAASRPRRVDSINGVTQTSRAQLPACSMTGVEAPSLCVKATNELSHQALMQLYMEE